MNNLNEFQVLTPEEVTETGKYFGLHCSMWIYVTVKNHHSGLESFINKGIWGMCNFSVMIPVKNSKQKPPKFDKEFLISRGVSEFWLD